MSAWGWQGGKFYRNEVKVSIDKLYFTQNYRTRTIKYKDRYYHYYKGRECSHSVYNLYLQTLYTVLSGEKIDCLIEMDCVIELRY